MRQTLLTLPPAGNRSFRGRALQAHFEHGPSALLASSALATAMPNTGWRSCLAPAQRKRRGWRHHCGAQEFAFPNRHSATANPWVPAGFASIASRKESFRRHYLMRNRGLELRNPQDGEIGFVLLLIKDLLTGDLPVGGTASVGRGAFTGRATLRLPDGLVADIELGAALPNATVQRLDREIQSFHDIPPRNHTQEMRHA